MMRVEVLPQFGDAYDGYQMRALVESLQRMLEDAQRDLAPSDLLVFDAYDTTGGQTFTSAVTVNLDTERLNADDGVFGMASDVLTVSLRGATRFLLLYRFGVEYSGSPSGSEGRVFVEQDTGSGYSELAGTRAVFGMPTGQDGLVVSGWAILDVEDGDKFRLRAERTSGSDTFATVADATGLVMVEMRD